MSSELELSFYQVPPKSKPLRTPAGINRGHFTAVVEAAVMGHALSGSRAAALDLQALALYSKLPQRVVKPIIESKEFHDAMLLRGVISAEATELDGEQLRALSVLMDTSKARSLETKLKAAGIPWYKWQAWMNDSTFRAAHDRMAHDLFKKMQSQVDVTVAAGALSGDLGFIKYYNEISGKHDPARRAHQDVQSILDGLADILMRHVTDRETLLAISSELSVLVAKLG